MSLSSLWELKKTYGWGTKKEIDRYVASEPGRGFHMSYMLWGEFLASYAAHYVPDGDTQIGEYIGTVLAADMLIRFGSSILQSVRRKGLQPMSRESGLVGKVRELLNH